MFSQLEKQTLNTVTELGSINSNKSFRIGEQFRNGFIKIFSDQHFTKLGRFKTKNFILKISGVWNNHTKCGLTFRFYLINHLLRNVEE